MAARSIFTVLVFFFILTANTKAQERCIIDAVTCSEKDYRRLQYQNSPAGKADLRRRQEAEQIELYK
jgi:hypothetical protein